MTTKLKSFLGTVGAIVGIISGISAFIILPYRVEAMQKQIDDMKHDHDILIGMQRDISYIKESVNRLEKK